MTFRRFNEPAMAKMLTDLLDKNGIEYEVEDNSLVFNPSFVANDELSKEYCIKLRKHDFEQVNALVIADEEQNIDHVEPDYYLFGFSDDELRDILINYDEWGAFDIALAKKILKERGISIDDKEIAVIQAERLDVLSKPEEAQTIWVVIGYMCILLGGILGIFIGWVMWRMKKTLPNGERVYSYTERDRKHGKIIFILSTIMFIISVCLRFYNAFRFFV